MLGGEGKVSFQSRPAVLYNHHDKCHLDLPLLDHLSISNASEYDNNNPMRKVPLIPL